MYLKFSEILWQKRIWALLMRKCEGLITNRQYLRVVITKKLEKLLLLQFLSNFETKIHCFNWQFDQNKGQFVSPIFYALQDSV